MNVENELIELAIHLAVMGHKGQMDKSGQPYILHVLRVGLAGATTEEKMVGFLHDIIEDTSYTLNHLRGYGFAEEVLSGVDAVTRRDGESYEDFILRAKEHPIGRKAKINDLYDNMRPDRNRNPSEEDLRRLEKYRYAEQVLTDTVPKVRLVFRRFMRDEKEEYPSIDAAVDAAWGMDEIGEYGIPLRIEDLEGNTEVEADELNHLVHERGEKYRRERQEREKIERTTLE